MIRTDDTQREICSLVRKGAVMFALDDMIAGPDLDLLYGAHNGLCRMNGVWFDPTRGEACFSVGDFVREGGSVACVGLKGWPVKMLPAKLGGAVMEKVREYRSYSEARSENMRIISDALDMSGESISLKEGPDHRLPHYFEPVLGSNVYYYIEGDVDRVFRHQRRHDEIFGSLANANFQGEPNVLAARLDDKCVNDIVSFLKLRLTRRVTESMPAGEQVRQNEPHRSHIGF